MTRIEYSTAEILERTLRVHHPAVDGRVVLRSELDWERDLEPSAVSDDGTTSTFTIEARQPFLRFKPCMRGKAGELRWSLGQDLLALLTISEVGNVYPHFSGSERGSFSDLIEVQSALLGREHMLRVYLPPGYRENPLRRYPVFYMLDGKNLFFPDEAFGGQDWQVDEALDLLDAMGVVDRVLVVGIHSGDRMTEYTKPGYEIYARSVVEEVRPVVERQFRVFGTRDETSVLGSSLGGVAAFHMAWQHPDVFGYAVCMSSPFSFQDDLIERVLNEPKSASKFYLDSGWPGDNYEVTLAMAMAFVERGYRAREDFLHLAFPLDRHDEDAWGRRLHLPLQLALGKPGTARRGRFV